jgi:hypothetical protein
MFIYILYMSYTNYVYLQLSYLRYSVFCQSLSLCDCVLSSTSLQATYVSTPGRSPNNSDIACRYTSGAEMSPNGSRRNRYRLFGVAIVHRYDERSEIGI